MAGSLIKPDPASETAALARARDELHAAESGHDHEALESRPKEIAD